MVHTENNFKKGNKEVKKCFSKEKNFGFKNESFPTERSHKK